MAKVQINSEKSRLSPDFFSRPSPVFSRKPPLSRGALLNAQCGQSGQSGQNEFRMLISLTIVINIIYYLVPS
jgi:hypothetical protein